MKAHEKSKIALYYWMIGKSYTDGAKALSFAEKHHTGMRKDGVTPEISHMLSIANHIRTLTESLLFPEITLIAGLLHDTPEDCPVSFEEIEARFGQRATVAIKKLTKKYQGMKLTPEEYYSQMSDCPIASIVKGIDRSHNFQTMNGVFTEEKKKQYIKECQDYLLPMLKQARKNFPEQELAYENVKQMLLRQIDLIEYSMRK